MNSFIKTVHNSFKPKKKPSNCSDILELKKFIEEISNRLGCRKEDVDRYLMMYGRYYAAR